MKKKPFYFATLALASFGFACFTLAGCDISLNLGDGNTGGNTGGNKGGDEVTQEQWVEIFSDTEKYVNFTSQVTGTVTMFGSSTGKTTVSSTIFIDGTKMYAESKVQGTADGEPVDTTGKFYGYFHSGHSYAWMYVPSEEIWEMADEVVGLGMIEIFLLDYSDCYDCFTYNSATHVYEATEAGLPLLSEKTQMQLSKFSFTLKDGAFTSAEMLSSFSVYGETITQNLKFSISNYNKTKVTLPDQVKSDLLEMGIQAE